MGSASTLLILVALLAPGQGSDEALRDRVAQLVERLDAADAEARAAAEAALLKLGPRVLPLLPESSGSAERRERLDRVRTALVEAQGPADLGASLVTIKGGGVRLSEAVRQLQAQTGNAITDLREQFGAEVTNPALDLEIEGEPFFKALDLIARKAGVMVTFYTGDGSVGLMAGPGTLPGAPAPEADPRVLYPGPFRVAFRQIVVAKDLQTGQGSANAQFEVAWEPRLRPMLLALKAGDLEVEDDRGRAVEPRVAMESEEVVLRQENPAAELNLNLAAPDREARRLARVRVKAEVTVPAALKTFRFPDLKDRGATQRQGDVSVTLAGFEVEEQTWKLDVIVAYPGGGPAFESYRQGLFNNRLWLQRRDGSRFEHNGGFSQTAGDAGRLGFEYLFVEPPGKPEDYQFVYETPGAVESIPLEFTFEDVPLP